MDVKLNGEQIQKEETINPTKRLTDRQTSTTSLEDFSSNTTEKVHLFLFSLFSC